MNRMYGQPAIRTDWRSEIDEEMLEYQILDGLTEDDYIAFPDELTQEGMEAILPDSMENGENQGDAGNAGVMNVME